MRACEVRQAVVRACAAGELGRLRAGAALIKVVGMLDSGLPCKPDTCIQRACTSQTRRLPQMSGGTCRMPPANTVSPCKSGNAYGLPPPRHTSGPPRGAGLTKGPEWPGGGWDGTSSRDVCQRGRASFSNPCRHGVSSIQSPDPGDFSAVFVSSSSGLDPHAVGCALTHRGSSRPGASDAQGPAVLGQKDLANAPRSFARERGRARDPNGGRHAPGGR
ncbi:hypothetical protein PSP20601_05034 [Pandoraea sputorum]|nr:hypothetical protein PSP20601_05034 [Pandoraea sputorum]